MCPQPVAGPQGPGLPWGMTPPRGQWREHSSGTTTVQRTLLPCPLTVGAPSTFGLSFPLQGLCRARMTANTPPCRCGFRRMMVASCTSMVMSYCGGTSPRAPWRSTRWPRLLGRRSSGCSTFKLMHDTSPPRTTFWRWSCISLRRAPHRTRLSCRQAWRRSLSPAAVFPPRPPRRSPPPRQPHFLPPGP